MKFSLGVVLAAAAACASAAFMEEEEPKQCIRAEDGSGAQCRDLQTNNKKTLGSVCIQAGSDVNRLNITFEARKGWALETVHAWIGANADLVPTTPEGALLLESFPLSQGTFRPQQEATSLQYDLPHEGSPCELQAWAVVASATITNGMVSVPAVAHEATSLFGALVAWLLPSKVTPKPKGFSFDMDCSCGQPHSQYTLSLRGVGSFIRRLDSSGPVGSIRAFRYDEPVIAATSKDLDMSQYVTPMTPVDPPAPAPAQNQGAMNGAGNFEPISSKDFEGENSTKSFEEANSTKSFEEANSTIFFEASSSTSFDEERALDEMDEIPVEEFIDAEEQDEVSGN